MNCQKAREEIKAYIDGELRPWTRWLVARHIASCPECRREMQEMNELTNDVRNSATVSAPQGLRDKVLGSLTFQPAGKEGKPVWQSLAPVALTLCVVVVFAAVVSPMFMKARSTSTRLPLGSMEAKARTPFTNVAPWPSPAKPAPGSAMPSLPSARQDKQVAQRPLNRPHALVAETAPSMTSAPARDVAPHTAGTAARSPSVNLLIIKTADVSVRVSDFQKANDEAVSIAKSAGGYVTDSSANSASGIPNEGTLTMRVPVEAFERTLNRLSKLGKVTARSINGEDVTGESVDLQSRLRNLRAEERQYLQIMNRANRIADIVTVTNELSRVRGEIEEAAGRLKYLQSSAAMSTINLTLAEKKRPQPHVSAIETTFGNAVAALGRSLNSLAAIVIWLLVYSPFWALPTGLWLYFRRRSAVVQQH